MPTIPMVKPVGIGDLSVIKQRIARYEAGEIAHIENILKSELKLREHRRRRELEEIVTTEQAREEENQRDLQTTERFELQNEIQKMVRSEQNLQAGASLSASYGPVSLSANASYASTGSTEESQRNSTRYAKEVTEKALSRLLEKTRLERRTRTLEEVEEKNNHTFDNTAGSEHVVGIYRWVDKYYRAKVVEYGRRLFYEFVVPEPAAFYLFAKKYNAEHGSMPVRPDAPTEPRHGSPLTPDGITKTNYLLLVAEHNAQGVEPPPPENLVISKSIARDAATGSDSWSFSNEEIEIPDGYAAHHLTALVGNISTDLPLFILSTAWGPGSTTGGIITLGPEAVGHLFEEYRGRFPISGLGSGSGSLVISVSVGCRVTDERMAKWQLNVYNSVMSAYQKRLMDYEDKLSAAQVQQSVQFGSGNPEMNRDIEKQELKRGCLALWAGWTSNRGAILEDPDQPIPRNYPEIDQGVARDNAEIVQFFEETFEWENIAYECYPYFWGRKTKWVDLMAPQCNDPAFERFLRAGAVRVRVPVRPSRTEAVLWYQLTGEIWSGGPVPALSASSDPPDPDVLLYDGYLAEMDGIEDMPDIDRDVELLSTDESTWLMKVPTTLVWLQQDARLPDFES